MIENYGKLIATFYLSNIVYHVQFIGGVTGNRESPLIDLRFFRGLYSFDICILKSIMEINMEKFLYT